MALNQYKPLRYLEEGGKVLGIDFFDFFIFLLFWVVSVRIAKIFYDPVVGGYVLLGESLVLVFFFVWDKRTTKKAWAGWLFHLMTYNQRVHPHNAFDLEPMPEKVVEILNSAPRK